MEFTLDYASLSKKLEIQELESPTGQSSPQVYGQLMAIYLLFNDLTSAKFLWKRIPQDIKDKNDELSVIWTVGKLMWRKDFAQVYDTINSWPSWPNHLKNIMNLILGTIRGRVTKLISRAYSTISIQEAARLLGLSEKETCELARTSDWVYDEVSGYFQITQSNTDSSKPSSFGSIVGMENSSELIEKLTGYIVFLESDK